tara:strand:- start:1654 stop:1947 length:294 start_codon:yes stop_codon:yes gene_type:complete
MNAENGYIKRASSTIPFGYELDLESRYLKPVAEQIEALGLVEEMIVREEISLQEAVDWLEYKTERSITRAGLKKHVDKKYGKRSERLGVESESLLAR